jgi:hypothetical protein
MPIWCNFVQIILEQLQAQLQLNDVTEVVQLYVQAQLQFACNQFCVSQFVQFTPPEMRQLLHWILPQLQFDVQFPLLQLP